jgi:hypothetical protein
MMFEANPIENFWSNCTQYSLARQNFLHNYDVALLAKKRVSKFKVRLH